MIRFQYFIFHRKENIKIMLPCPFWYFAGACCIHLYVVQWNDYFMYICSLLTKNIWQLLSIDSWIYGVVKFIRWIKQSVYYYESNGLCKQYRLSVYLDVPLCVAFLFNIWRWNAIESLKLCFVRFSLNGNEWYTISSCFA